MPFVYYFWGYLFTVYALLVYKIWDWYSNVWIITSSGVIDVNWSLLRQQTEYIGFDNMQGVEIEQKGADKPIGRGTVVIRLAGSGDEFILTGAANPHEINDILHEGMQHHGHHEHFEEDKEPFEVLLQTLQDVVKDHLNKKGYADEYAIPDEEETERTLRKKGTIDLR